MVAGLGEHLPLGNLARVEAGAGSERLGLGLVVQASIHNAMDAYTADALGEPVVFAGDFRLIDVGLGGRLPLGDTFRIVPHLDLGLTALDSPIVEGALEEAEIEASVGRQARGLWAQAGAELGFDVRPDAVTLYGAVDVVYRSVPGLSLSGVVRAGLAARF